ncbi:MAG: LysR family transcriptional regulator [Paracoccus sp. (in: a-proteobacteria)]|uniref:LysR family transcriptional regulator n=1 Tax=Paracoccus sp. TaxID=267 RepID=UPI0026DF90B1|nr:LysR family transcriptional regulator [Paracoccus sp. (in: a-proteobacteria)]MDO5612904.1 LysR family transcriptional regulator [Paracoccus sp. (in: a-proteobacteria)]
MRRDTPTIGKEVSIIGKDGFIWDDVQCFVAIARTGSLSGAAARLGVGLATVSRRIARFESAMGQPLFTRQQSGYALTADGAALIDRAEAIEAAALSLHHGAAAQAEVAGRVRLATAENLATGLILPELARLRDRHPQLVVEVLTDIATVSLHRRDADIALRMVRPERGNVVVQRLGVLGFGLYAAPAYLAVRPAEDAFIAWPETQAHLPAAQWSERRWPGRAPAVVSGTLAGHLAACAGGMGLAVLPHFLARPRGLTCVQAEAGLDQVIWLVTQSDLAGSRRVQAVATFLRDLVAQNRHRLAGTAA